jgi:argininosuccinate synthase
MRILLAYSGGLDTSYLVARLTGDGHEVVACTVDCGGFEDAEREQIASRAAIYGASAHLFLDARQAMFDQVLRWLIAANVLRGRVYPLSVGAERGLQAEVLASYALEHGFDALAHGCTAAGNDQVRFDAALRVVAPLIQVLAPIRDQAPSREQQVAWMQERGLPLPTSGGGYSVNAGLWGLTIGGGPLLVEDGELEESAWQWTQPQSSAPTAVTVSFEKGLPCSLDGQAMDPVTLIEMLNRSAGAAGVGRGFHLGDTVLGIKGRIAFEAPAAAVLLEAHRELEKLVLTEDQRFWKDHLGEVYGRHLHQGRFHDPLLRDLEQFFASSQDRVCGEVKVALRGGHAQVVAMNSPFSMMQASDAAYGERAANDSDAAGLRTFARVLAEPAALHARAGQQGNASRAASKSAPRTSGAPV